MGIVKLICGWEEFLVSSWVACILYAYATYVQSILRISRKKYNTRPTVALYGGTTSLTNAPTWASLTRRLTYIWHGDTSRAIIMSIVDNTRASVHTHLLTQRILSHSPGGAVSSGPRDGGDMTGGHVVLRAPLACWRCCCCQATNGRPGPELGRAGGRICHWIIDQLPMLCRWLAGLGSGAAALVDSLKADSTGLEDSRGKNEAWQ